MSMELLMLAASIGLLTLLTVIQGTQGLSVFGQLSAAGNPCDISACQGWQDRLSCAIRQLIDALIIFAPLVIAVDLFTTKSAQSAFGAQLFFVSRVGHVAFYLAGFPVARTGAGFTSVMGILMMAAGFFH